MKSPTTMIWKDSLSCNTSAHFFSHYTTEPPVYFFPPFAVTLNGMLFLSLMGRFDERLFRPACSTYFGTDGSS